MHDPEDFENIHAEPRTMICFGDFAFDPGADALLLSGRQVELGSRALAVLSALLEAEGELVSKAALLDHAWPGIAVEENNLQVQVCALRKVLGDERNRIRTVPGRGYRFTGPTCRRRPEKQPGPARASDGAGRPQLSVVVLPFTNLSADPALDYLVDGITDSLMTDLSRALPGSFVVSRSTAFTFRGRDVDARRIGEQLGVRYVLEGSVLAAGDTLRVNAQLIDAMADVSLWAERFDKARRNVLQVQDEIVGRLSRAAGLEVTRRAASEAEDKQDPEAFDLALRGRAVVHARITTETAGQACILFRRALAMDPDCAEALVGLASVLVFQVVNFYRTDRDAALGEADALLERALTAAPGHLAGLKTRGIVLRARGDFTGAIAVNETVLAQNPGEPTACREIGLNSLYLGRFAEAVSWFESAVRIAPLDPVRWTWLQGLGRALIGLGRDDEAARALRLAAESRPGVPEVYGLLVAAEALAGHTERTDPLLADYIRREPGMTLRCWASRSHVAVDAVAPDYLRANARVTDGLRLAGLPEG